MSQSEAGGRTRVTRSTPITAWIALFASGCVIITERPADSSPPPSPPPPPPAATAAAPEPVSAAPAPAEPAAEATGREKAPPRPPSVREPAKRNAPGAEP